ncbi:phospholipase D family protein [Bacillus sp. ISL-35]|uniref:phospholipase D family protein n=1 Tax=Bacillus sp. ISL-35 TaxID=2819122 RepID=UPI001BEA7F10|nr:phospholipase D family protein [Bacillus sp. ISL-35]MBT2679277.1 phospholipase D family protein [Bacillus sp. ISL-35]MBT2703173.1 phospholipase D family protein [Chryseobacterium sp. ISL-80]
MIIHNSEILEKLILETISSKEEILILSAYIKLNTLKMLDQKLDPNVKQKKIMVRFRLNDLIVGSSDIEIYNYCKENNWRLYVDTDLHSKIYIFDRKKAIIGSANLTSSGMQVSQHSNIESAVFTEVTGEEEMKINKMFDEAVLLNDKIYSSMLKQLSRTPRNGVLEEKLEWNDDLKKQLKPKEHFLWISDMFSSESPFNLDQHDLELLELGISQKKSLESIKDCFIRSKPYKWLKSVIKEEIYFGELTSKLHSSLIDDSRVFRKDVKVLLSNLLNWVTELEIEELIIDRPNYSQRIRHRKF